MIRRILTCSVDLSLPCCKGYLSRRFQIPRLEDWPSYSWKAVPGRAPVSRFITPPQEAPWNRNWALRLCCVRLILQNCGGWIRNKYLCWTGKTTHRNSAVWTPQFKKMLLLLSLVSPILRHSPPEDQCICLSPGPCLCSWSQCISYMSVPCQGVLVIYCELTVSLHIQDEACSCMLHPYWNPVLGMSSRQNSVLIHLPSSVSLDLCAKGASFSCL